LDHFNSGSPSITVIEREKQFHQESLQLITRFSIL